MEITSTEELGLRCVLELARSYGQGPLSASEIAHREGLTLQYVSKFMYLFRHGRLIHAARGIHGGYELAHPPAQINLKQVFDVLSASKKKRLRAKNRVSTQHQGCVHQHDCTIKPVRQILSTYVDELLISLSLQDLLCRRTGKEWQKHVQSAAFRD